MISRKMFIRTAVVAVTGSFLVFQAGCSKNEEKQAAEAEEKGRIEQMTDRAADKAVTKIRTPIDKAHNTQDLGDERLQSMDEALRQQ